MNALEAMRVEADETNRGLLSEYANVLYNGFPRNAWGSEVKRDAWIARGGLLQIVPTAPKE